MRIARVRGHDNKSYSLVGESDDVEQASWHRTAVVAICFVVLASVAGVMISNMSCGHTALGTNGRDPPDRLTCRPSSLARWAGAQSSVLAAWLRPGASTGDIVNLDTADAEEYPLDSSSAGSKKFALRHLVVNASSGVSLFCFSVVRAAVTPTVNEPMLMSLALKYHTNIFACDEYKIYSDMKMWFTADGRRDARPPHLDEHGANIEQAETTVIPISFTGQVGSAGAQTASWLNTDTFLKAWDAVISSGRFHHHDWVVKVDPDAVFIPRRLRLHLYGASRGSRNDVLPCVGPLVPAPCPQEWAVTTGGYVCQSSGRCRASHEGPFDKEDCPRQCYVGSPVVQAEPYWTVVYQGGVNVRASNDTMSAVLGVKPPNVLVKGEMIGKWLKLESERGFMLAEANGQSYLRQVDLKHPEVEYRNDVPPCWPHVEDMCPSEWRCCSGGYYCGHTGGCREASAGPFFDEVCKKSQCYVGNPPDFSKAHGEPRNGLPPCSDEQMVSCPGDWRHGRGGYFCPVTGGCRASTSGPFKSCISQCYIGSPPASSVQVFSEATTGPQLYLINCDTSFGFYGALEVVSRGGVLAYSRGQECCKRQLQYQGWGEDRFMKECFDMLGIKALEDFQLLSDEYCVKNGIPVDCNSASVAFHPFKTKADFSRCAQIAVRRGDYVFK